MSIIRRARPLLGTLIEIRVEGMQRNLASSAIDIAFAEIAQIHCLMSFHEPGSDLSRLHRARAGAWVSVDARTREVLAYALCVARESNGCFDPTVAAEQVASGYLPQPHSAFVPDSNASWRDIELNDDGVRLRKPLWIDLGGIAKGYAVDRAVQILLETGAPQACVNAGGDLRIAGPRAECVHVRDASGAITAAIELGDAAIASSTSMPTHAPAAHRDGENKQPIEGGVTASVIATNCMTADALTKVVLARGAASARTLAAFGAQARVHDLRSDRGTFGVAA